MNRRWLLAAVVLCLLFVGRMIAPVLSRGGTPKISNWPDRRIIGAAYLASAPRKGSFPTRTSNNPRNYFVSSNLARFDIRSPSGLECFQNDVLQQAKSIVNNLIRLNAQGVITWDIEGEQFPQTTSYVCSPDMIATAAPEMESRVSDSASPYAGMKLDDAYFKTIRDAGFRVGVCVRPQRFTIGADGTAKQETLSNDEVPEQLIRKMSFARDRWGASIFYLDSTVQSSGFALNTTLLEKAAAAFPDALIIPEHSFLGAYKAMAPFKSFIFHNEVSTPAWVRLIYPQAFSVNLINDVDGNKLSRNQPSLSEAVRRGDILMVHADYWHSNNDVVKDIYVSAGR